VRGLGLQRHSRTQKPCHTDPPSCAGYYGQRNVWVLKPAGKSRGRGIRVFNRLDQIMHYIGEETPEDHLWVAQKYMENPLLIKQRKFDIRQWVLVTSWNPLTIWFYSECYIRFCAEPFTLRDLENNFIHLTNNSVAKHSTQFHELNIGEGNMWDFSQFQEWLQHTTGDDQAWQGIATSMRDIARQALMCAQGEVQNRKGSCELFGFDFCFDEDHKVRRVGPPCRELSAQQGEIRHFRLLSFNDGRCESELTACPANLQGVADRDQLLALAGALHAHHVAAGHQRAGGHRESARRPPRTEGEPPPSQLPPPPQLPPHCL
jgi:hypothetical protein